MYIAMLIQCGYLTLQITGGKKAERGTSGAFCRPSVFVLLCVLLFFISFFYSRLQHIALLLYR